MTDGGRGEPAEQTAAWLKARMRGRQWTASDLARALDVGTGTVSRWLRAVQPPAPAYCDRIADVFGVEADLVLTLAGHRPATEPLSPDDPRARLVALLKRVDLDRDERAWLLELQLTGWLDFDRNERRGGA